MGGTQSSYRRKRFNVEHTLFEFLEQQRRVARREFRDMSRIKMRPRVFFLLNRAQRALKTRFERETKRHLDGLTSVELGALWALVSGGSLGVQQLARVLHVDHAVVSRLSKQLVRKQVVERVTDPDDGRRTQLELTALGRQRAAEGQRLLRIANARTIDGFTADEQAVIVRFLENLIAFGSEQTPLHETPHAHPGGTDA